MRYQYAQRCGWTSKTSCRGKEASGSILLSVQKRQTIAIGSALGVAWGRGWQQRVTAGERSFWGDGYCGHGRKTVNLSKVIRLHTYRRHIVMAGIEMTCLLKSGSSAPFSMAS